MKTKSNVNKKLGKEIKKIIRVEKYQILCCILQIMFIVALVVLSISLKEIIDIISNGETVKAKNIIVILVAFIFYFISYYFGPISYRYLYATAERRLCTYLVEKTLEQDQEFFVEHDQGYIETVIEDVSADVARHYGSFFINCLTDSLELICYFGIMFYYSWQLTIITIILLAIVMYLTKGIVNKQAEILKVCKEGQSKVTTHLLETISNVNLIKMVDKTKYYSDSFNEDFTDNFSKPYLKYRILDAIYTTLYAVLLYILPLLILILGLVLKDVFMISLGSTISVYSLLGNLQEPIRDIAALTSQKKQNNENIKFLEGFMMIEVKSDLPKVEKFECLKFKSKGIQFDNNEILKGVSFEIFKNDFVLLRGESGCGKSTIFKHIIKNDSKPEVEVLLNDNNIKDYNIFPDILMIQQKNSLFTTTIIGNIKCGYEATKEELEEVYNVCMLNDFINKYGENKSIDNISSNISGGEIQRICIARILLRKPKLLLMDEITSSLDPATTNAIAQNIYDFAKKYNITVIAISHKDEFDKFANKVIDLKSLRKE